MSTPLSVSQERGATRACPGSHEWPVSKAEWPEDRMAYTPGPEPSSRRGVASSAMPRGSGLIYTGRTVHGAGHNQTDKPVQETQLAKTVCSILYVWLALLLHLGTFVSSINKSLLRP